MHLAREQDKLLQVLDGNLIFEWLAKDN